MCELSPKFIGLKKVEIVKEIENKIAYIGKPKVM